MTYQRIAQLFETEFARRAQGMSDGKPFRLIHRGGARLVISGDPVRPDAALAPSREILEAMIPWASAETDPIAYGCGDPVGWLWFGAEARLLAVHEVLPDFQADGAVTLALAWVW